MSFDFSNILKGVLIPLHEKVHLDESQGRAPSYAIMQQKNLSKVTNHSVLNFFSISVTQSNFFACKCLIIFPRKENGIPFEYFIMWSGANERELNLHIISEDMKTCVIE